jgi:hypothetical protein
MRILYFLIAIVFTGCASKKPISAFEYVISHNDPNLKRVFSNKDKYELQLYYTRVLIAPQKISFNSAVYQSNEENYFYPASTVKLPIAVLALEKLEKRNDINLNSKYKIQGDDVYHSIADDITSLFAISDNDSFNRLFDFLGGQDSINERLKSLKINAQINHRLSVPNSEALTTKEIVFDNGVVISNNQNQPINQLKKNALEKGKGFFSNDTLIEKPMDFSYKNYYSIEAMHGTLRRIFYPNSFPKNQRFNLKETTIDFLKESMKKVPREAGYTDEKYTDSYVKFFLYGDSKNQLPKHIEIYNKVGQAYGTLTDNAYVVDKKNNITFFLTATLLVNENEIFNDDVYEYETVGIPFLAALGRAFYEYELKNK